MAGKPSGVPGTLIMALGRPRAAEEAQPFGDRRLGVAGQVGRDLEAGEAIAAAGRVVDGAEDVGGHADVLDGEGEEDRLRVALAAGDDGAQGVVVVG